MAIVRPLPFTFLADGPIRARWRIASSFPSTKEVLFDFIDGMFCQIFVDFRNNSTLHLSMKGMPQFCERTGRGGDNENLHVALMHQCFKGRSDAPGETMLLELMPIGVSHPSSAISAGTLERTARPIAALLARRRVFVNVDAFSLEVWKLGIARIAQEQRLAAITNEHESVVGNLKLAHSISAWMSARRWIASADG